MDPSYATLGSDKVSRARLPEARARGGKIWRPRLARWWNDFARELAYFPESAHDDQVDVLSYLCRLAQELSPVSMVHPQTGGQRAIPKRF
jgi:predicted phage terminase large subunit-like protein